MTGFHEVQFPPDISYGASGGPGYSTTVVTTVSGHERRNANWAMARGRWNVAHGLKKREQVAELIAFFRARRGRAFGFRFKDWTVPTIAQWRLSTLPRYLPPPAIEKLIASCDPTARAGIRDRAILLLLARLGLRAGDILMMRLGDIDWEAGTLTVCGKGRREVRLPLPQDAGDALLAYLTQKRPTVDGDRVFLRSRAPYRPFRNNGAIAWVVKSALEQAGITDAPSRGAHLLRHSAATAWLRNGATLDAIGAVLRHQSVETTTLHAKVDIPTLRKIAQPWQGELPC